MRFKNTEYDDMKNLLAKTRVFLKPPLHENSIPALQPQEMNDEKKRFTEAVTPNVQFGEFRLGNGNVEWSGVLVREKITFVYSLDESIGCFISCEQTQLSDDTVKVLQNLKAYYDSWSEYWGQEISNR